MCTQKLAAVVVCVYSKTPLGHAITGERRQIGYQHVSVLVSVHMKLAFMVSRLPVLCHSVPVRNPFGC
jgi:hypothetical protein